MSIYSIVSLFNTFAFASLGLFVFIKRPKGSVQRWWCLFMLCSAGWSFGTAWANNTTNPDFSLFWYRFLNCFAALIPAFFLKFVSIFVFGNKERTLITRTSFVISFSILTLSLLFPSLFVVRVDPGNYFNFVPRPGTVYHFYSLYFLASVFYAHWILFQSYRIANHLRRNQIKYLFISMLVGFSGGGSTFLITYGIEFPYGNFYVSLFGVIASYAIVSHRLMDIEVIIKKTLVFAGLSFVVFAMFAVPFFLLTNVLQLSLAGQTRLWFFALVGMAVAAAAGPLNTFLVNATDKYLFQKKINYRLLLKEASEYLAHVDSLQKQTRRIAAFLLKKARITSASIS